MRQQYHFRHHLDDVHIWDVNKLVALTAGLSAEPVAVDAIEELNQTYWYDVEGDSPTCRSIAQHMALVLAADLSYPIILCPEGKVMDGMHRAVKALLQKHTTLLAYRLPNLPPPDFINVAPDDLYYGEE